MARKAYKARQPPRMRMKMPQGNAVMKATTGVIVGGSTLILGVGALGLASGVVKSLHP
jgi:hypothetical protein